MYNITDTYPKANNYKEYLEIMLKCNKTKLEIYESGRSNLGLREDTIPYLKHRIKKFEDDLKREIEKELEDAFLQN